MIQYLKLCTLTQYLPNAFCSPTLGLDTPKHLSSYEHSWRVEEQEDKHKLHSSRHEEHNKNIDYTARAMKGNKKNTDAENSSQVRASGHGPIGEFYLWIIGRIERE